MLNTTKVIGLIAAGLFAGAITAMPVWAQNPAGGLAVASDQYGGSAGARVGGVSVGGAHVGGTSAARSYFRGGRPKGLHHVRRHVFKARHRRTTGRLFLPSIGNWAYSWGLYFYESDVNWTYPDGYCSLRRVRHHHRWVLRHHCTWAFRPPVID